MTKLEAYKKKLNILKEISDVQGVLLVGKGATTAESEFENLNDIDLIVLTQMGEKNRRVVEVIDGIDFDMSYLPIVFVEQSIDAKAILWIEILASSKIVYDKGIEHLIKKCKDIWEKGSKPLTAIEKEYRAFYLTTTLEDIYNRLSEPALAKYLMINYLNDLMKVVFEEACYFIPLKKKRWINKIKGFRPSIACQIETILMIDDVTAQYEQLKQLYSEVINPLGGPCNTWSHKEFPE